MTANIYCPRCKRQHVVIRPQARRGPEPINWQDVGEIVGGTLIFGTLFFGIPFLLFLIGAPQ